MGCAVSPSTAATASTPDPVQHAATMSDEGLVAAVAGGDLSSLGVLFDRHAQGVRRFIGRLGVAPSDVDDLTQTTFLLLLEAARSFRGGPSARPWLLGLATNVARRHRRSTIRMAARIAAWASERYASGPPTPGEALDVQERAVRAAHALMLLSPKKREVFVMVAMEAVPAEVAADLLGIPLGTVWTRLHHARRELQAHLLEEGP
jgi:RNA polymerase sigma factor (sigma-70 family)